MNLRIQLPPTGHNAHVKDIVVSGTAIAQIFLYLGQVQAKEPRQQQHETIATSKPKRNTKRPARLNDTMTCASSIAIDDVPTIYSEAVRDSENEK
nr:retrovirus-related Pol polyprotein from transposon TNT 1-94 [Tanacetum cinerariifolium]